MRIPFAMLLVLLQGGCSSVPKKETPDIPPTAYAAMERLYVGMTENQALEIMKPVSLNWGRATSGGSGAGQLIFEISETKQLKLDVEPEKSGIKSSVVDELNPSLKNLNSAPQFVVTSISHLEPKTNWKLDANHQVIK